VSPANGDSERSSGLLRSKEWYLEFISRYSAELVAEGSDVSQAEADPNLSAEWTAVMGLFLNRFAGARGLRAKWEVQFFDTQKYRRLDQAWFRGDAEGYEVGIEHQSWWDGAIEKVITLRMSQAPLGVLITYVPYPGEAPRRQLAHSVGKLLSASTRRDAFLLVLGDSRLPSVEGWEGFSWDGERRALERIADARSPA
jgi:hypothetical protein